MVNLGVKQEIFKFIKDREGDSLVCLFKMSLCESVDRFKNRHVAFRPIQILEIKEKGGKQ